MLSTNDVSWLGAWLLLLMIPVTFFCKKSEDASATLGCGMKTGTHSILACEKYVLRSIFYYVNIGI